MKIDDGPDAGRSPFWDGMAPLEVALKVAWIFVRVLVALALIAKGSYFFYQGF